MNDLTSGIDFKAWEQTSRKAYADARKQWDSTYVAVADDKTRRELDAIEERACREAKTERVGNDISVPFSVRVDVDTGTMEHTVGAGTPDYEKRRIAGEVKNHERYMKVACRLQRKLAQRGVKSENVVKLPKF